MLAALASALLTICAPGPAALQPTCVTDGDTFRLNAERIRIANIDTAELNGRCPSEKALAIKARNRLLQLLNSGEVSIERTGVDRYGRVLAVVRVDGVLVADVLIREKLGRVWSGRREGWCE